MHALRNAGAAFVPRPTTGVVGAERGTYSEVGRKAKGRRGALRRSTDPGAGVVEEFHPRALFGGGPLVGVPAERDGAMHALGVWHQDRNAASRRRERGHAEGRAVRIERVVLGDLMAVVDVAGGD